MGVNIMLNMAAVVLSTVKRANHLFVRGNITYNTAAVEIKVPSCS